MEGAVMSDVVLHTERLHLSRGTRPILTGVTLNITRGELVALMGPSGSGKTTILRAVAGLERFDTGTIVVDGVPLAGGAPIPAATLRQLRRKVGMVFQFHCLFEHLSALSNVCLAPVHAHGVAPADAATRGQELLAAFGVEHRANAYPRELSGGEAQRVAIARALAVDPPLLLMDEPTASLDPERREELGELLQGLVRQQRTLVVSTHDEEFARGFATRIVRLRDGVVV
jgi:ABC-type polar amino acid transport system ATPase subunit